MIFSSAPIAAGGAIGGAVVAIGAPLVFTSYLEFPLGLSLCCALILARILTHADAAGLALHQRLIPAVGLILATIAPLAFLPGSEPLTTSSFRNFYGIIRLRVLQRDQFEWAKWIDGLSGL